MDITKPLSIVAPAMVSILVCDFFFHKLNLSTILLGFTPLLIFAALSTLLTYITSSKKKLRPIKIFTDGNFLKIIRIITIISFASSTYLVINFSREFGFDSIFTKADLLQSNAITNSLGNLLYFNVFLLPIFLKILSTGKSKTIYATCSALSLFFLYFAGIKSYLFQSILLCAFVFLQGKNFKNIALTFFLTLAALLTYFIFYDTHIDLSANNTFESLQRFLAYFSGSWATFESYLENPPSSQHQALGTFFPFYKIISNGEISLSEYLRFFSIEGFELNVIPLFQMAYLEGGVFLQLFVIISSAFTYSFTRILASIYENNIFLQIFHAFFCSTFVISSLFANVFGDLHLYISFAIIFLAAVTLRRNKIRRD